MDYVALGRRIREIRISKKMTQTNVAELAGIEASNLSHIERAATKVSLPTLINIANALEVSIDELVYNSLAKNKHIYNSIINDLLKDCTAYELYALTEIIKTAKSVLKNKKV